MFLVAQLIHYSSCVTAHSFSDPSISIAEAPSTHQFQLNRHPRPDIFSSPARQKYRHLRDGSGSETVNTIFSGVYPVLNITITGKKSQDFVSFIDTGSSDTWVMASNFQCLNIDTRVPMAQEACGFGTLYDASLGSFKNITTEEFSISYFPENESLDGSMGYASLKLGGLTVPKQEVALITKAAWTGDGTTSGLLGLAYPSITSASYRKNHSQAVYNPVFTTMVEDKIVSDAVFTLALDRVPRDTSPSAPAGVMAFGGLVSSSYYQSNFTTVSIEESPGTGLSFYTITHEFLYGLKNGTVVSGGTYQSIVDSGTAPNFIPTAAAKDLNEQFSPPAVYNETLGYWTVDCNATAPYAAYNIGGKVMPMNATDMIVRSLNGLPGYEDVCFSAFADGGEPTNGNVFIIGAVWQLGYVVAYDVGNTKLHFADRAPY